MPHDKNGKEIKPGDKVTIEMTVTAIYPGAEMCNVSLARSVDGEQSLNLTCQAKQCELTETQGPREPAPAVSQREGALEGVA